MAARYIGITEWVWKKISKFDYDKYWKYRERVVSSNCNKFVRYYCLYKVKRMDARHNASLGTHIDFESAFFQSRPILPHGLNGIIISNDCRFGKDCTIYHQVTIASWGGGGPKIGDYVLIGAGAKIIGNITIGNHVKIGAGCIVTKDIPDNATVVMPHPRVIIQKGYLNEDINTIE